MTASSILIGNLELQVDEKGLEASLSFSPDPEGPQWDRQKAYGLLEERGICEGIDNEALDSLFDPEQQSDGRRSAGHGLVVARGTAPQEAQPSELTVEKLEIPETLQSYLSQVIPSKRKPEVYQRTVEKVKSQRIVTKKSKLPFLPAKEQKEVVWKKSEQLIRLKEPGEEQGRGFARKGDVVAVVAPGQRARAGRDVFGKEIPTDSEVEALYLGTALKQIGTEIRADLSGFFRYGSNWIELFPFSPHEHKVFASEDNRNCLLDFVPGSDLASPPTAEQILEEARSLGFSPEELLEVDQLAGLLSQALTDKTALKAEPVSRAADAQIEVVITEDKLSAHLNLRKGRGKGKPLRLREVGEAIRGWRFKGMDIPRVQEDILTFHRGPENHLDNYLLLEGREAEQGEDGRIEWRVSFLPETRVAELREQASERFDQLEAIHSLVELPIDAVQTMAEVQEQATIAEIMPSTVGDSGIDVFGTVRPGIKGDDVQLIPYENLKRIGNEIIATLGGLLDKAELEGQIHLRVRPHQDREIQVSLAEDRMQAFLTLLPSQGTGTPPDLEAVNRIIAEAGIVKGIDNEAIIQAVERAKEGEEVEKLLFARGQDAVHGQDMDLEILTRLASGQRVTVRKNGRADFRQQDKITMVKSDTLLARLGVPTVGIDGWDVAGKALPARRGTARYVKVGKNVECREQEDGSLQYFSKIDGELDYQGSSIDVLRVHTVEGNVSLESGNVTFSGTVRVTGTVQSGFSVVSTENIFVEGSVQGALLSAGESARIEKGIIGEGKAVLRAKKNIRAHFAEQATLLAVENIHLINACLRCTVKCNGRVTLESERGNIIGGRVYCKLGVEAMNLGSEREVPTEIHFGQDILVQDHLEREQRHAEELKKRNLEIERSIRNLERTTPSDKKGLQRLHAEKLKNLRQIQIYSKRVFILEERLEQHFPSEITVRGVVYPGVILSSHGRQREIKTALREVIFFFNTTTGRIEEKPLSG
jgi:uncharacterized protein (DUF342 family)